MKRKNEDISDDEMSISSDDSLDGDVRLSQAVSQDKLGNAPASAGALHARYGVGASIMSKMGYTEGNSLGAEGSKGILEPIDPTKRAKLTGLGYASFDHPASSSEPVSEEEQENHKRRNKEALLNRLELLLAYLDNTKPETMDIMEFYTQFGDLPNWHQAKLWEILETSAATQLIAMNLDDFRRPKVMDLLDLLNKILPESRYNALLDAAWYQKVANALSKSPESLQDILFETVYPMFQLRHKSFVPIGSKMSELIAANADCVHTVLRSVQRLEDTLQLIPSLQQNLYTLALDGKLNQEETLVLCSALSAPRTFTILSKKLSKLTFAEQLTQLNSWESLLKSKSLLGAALEECFATWYAELMHQLRSGEYTADSWEKAWLLAANYHGYEGIADKWRLIGLNTINEFLDCQVLGSESTHEADSNRCVLGKHVQLADILDWYCKSRGISAEFFNPSSGMVRSASGSTRWRISEEVLYVHTGADYTPVSIYDLDQFISGEPEKLH